MSFVEKYKDFNFEDYSPFLNCTDESQVLGVLAKEYVSYSDFLTLLSPAAENHLLEMAKKSMILTRKHFGKTIQLYAPLYLSNECENECLYCGFNKNHNINRVTLTMEQIEEEVKLLSTQGFDSILLLTGEAPEKIGVDYVCDSIKVARKYFDYVALEIFSGSKSDYAKYIEAGASGVTIYQETYNHDVYRKLHLSGPKADYLNRLDAPDRMLSAGVRKVGLGALLGLYDWKYEVASLGFHVEYLMKKYWKSEISVSFPRMRDVVIFETVSDKHLVQMMLALRIFQPTLGLLLSTREPAEIRDKMIDIGITQISAESKTNPGGYSGNSSDEQFSVADQRSLQEVIQMLKEKGFDSVLKDWSPEFEKIVYR